MVPFNGLVCALRKGLLDNDNSPFLKCFLKLLQGDLITDEKLEANIKQRVILILMNKVCTGKVLVQGSLEFLSQIFSTSILNNYLSYWSFFKAQEMVFGSEKIIQFLSSS